MPTNHHLCSQFTSKTDPPPTLPFSHHVPSSKHQRDRWLCMAVVAQVVIRFDCAPQICDAAPLARNVWFGSLAQDLQSRYFHPSALACKREPSFLHACHRSGERRFCVSAVYAPIESICSNFLFPVLAEPMSLSFNIDV